MKKIKAVFIDIDDTLLDFDKCADEAMCIAAEEAGITFPKDYFEIFTRNNNQLWRDIEQKKIVLEELYDIRWKQIFSEMGIEADGRSFEESFRAKLDTCAIPFEGAKELLEHLSKKYRIFAASNAPSGQQQSRLKKSGLIDYIEKFFVSEELGFSKPSKEYFDKCFEQLPDITPDETVMIGDSYTADISGAHAYGLVPVWFNHRQKNIENPCTVYVAKTAQEIINLMDKYFE